MGNSKLLERNSSATAGTGTYRPGTSMMEKYGKIDYSTPSVSSCFLIVTSNETTHVTTCSAAGGIAHGHSPHVHAKCQRNGMVASWE